MSTLAIPDAANRYLELLAEKEQCRVANKLTPEAAAYFAVRLDQIWNVLDEDEQTRIDGELSAQDGGGCDRR